MRQRLKFEAEVTGNLEHPDCCRLWLWLRTITDALSTPCVSSEGWIFASRSTCITSSRLSRSDRAGPRGNGHAEAEKQVLASGRELDDDAWLHERRALVTKFVVACELLIMLTNAKFCTATSSEHFMVGKHGEIFVVDWGLAKTANVSMSNESTVTHGTETHITLLGWHGNRVAPGASDWYTGYMSPEQRGMSTRLGPPRMSTAWEPRSTRS